MDKTDTGSDLGQGIMNEVDLRLADELYAGETSELVFILIARTNNTNINIHVFVLENSHLELIS